MATQPVAVGDLNLPVWRGYFFSDAPLIHKHGFELGKLYFLLQFAYFQLLLVCVVHLSVKICRGRGTLPQTATIYCIWSGITWPIGFVMYYPLFFFIPVDDFFYGTDSSYNIALVPRWVWWWTLVFVLVTVPIGFLTVSQWIADVHQITKLRLLLGVIFVYTPIMMLHNRFVAAYISKGLRLASDFVTKLL